MRVLKPCWAAIVLATCASALVAKPRDEKSISNLAARDLSSDSVNGPIAVANRKRQNPGDTPEGTAGGGSEGGPGALGGGGGEGGEGGAGGAGGEPGEPGTQHEGTDADGGEDMEQRLKDKVNKQKERIQRQKDKLKHEKEEIQQEEEQDERTMEEDKNLLEHPTQNPAMGVDGAEGGEGGGAAGAGGADETGSGGETGGAGAGGKPKPEPEGDTGDMKKREIEARDPKFTRHSSSSSSSNHREGESSSTRSKHGTTGTTASKSKKLQEFFVVPKDPHSKTKLAALEKVLKRFQQQNEQAGHTTKTGSTHKTGTKAKRDAAAEPASTKKTSTSSSHGATEGDPKIFKMETKQDGVMYFQLGMTTNQARQIQRNREVCYQTVLVVWI